jgi:hypothetical protein
MPIQSQPPTEPAVFLTERDTILIAEDPFVSSFLRTMLQRHGHRVVTGEALHASELLRQGSVVADVVITNQPDAFLDSAGKIHLLYLAASPDLHLASQFPNCRVLRKPFRNDELLQAVDSLTHSVTP